MQSVICDVIFLEMTQNVANWKWNFVIQGLKFEKKAFQRSDIELQFLLYFWCQIWLLSYIALSKRLGKHQKDTEA